ncbi:unnamed protein product [Schistocephalus solidus]|uniref:Carn_acyltransf domain-containing protein n=1 Tax=Schistocephalus solidus TaxID=70667 RepID=A0A183TF38_SCHSO|nr:unnamed protein product [Schistocephalus solidus]
MVLPFRACASVNSHLWLHFKRNLSEKIPSSTKFIHESYLSTDYFQKSLPHLRVPELSKTLERYLLSQLTDDFMEGAGPQLQTSLVNYDKQLPESNYVSKIWFDMYLKDRRPLVLTHNPALVFKDSAIGADYNKPTIRATNMVCSSLRFLDAYRAGKLKPEVYHLNPRKSDTSTFERFIGLLPHSIATYGAYIFKALDMPSMEARMTKCFARPCSILSNIKIGDFPDASYAVALFACLTAFPLDMSQFDNLFNSTRIAAPEQDELRKFPESRHLAVISKGDIFIFDIIDEKGCHLNPRQILANLEFIQHQPARTQRTPNRSSGLGIITAMPRDMAVMARDRLESLGNGRNLDLIDSALFVLVLSEETTDHFPGVLSDMVAGPADSRWFDKSFSLIVNQSGTAGINFEHSWGDGVAVLRFFNEIFKDTELKPAVHPDVLSGTDS